MARVKSGRVTSVLRTGVAHADPAVRLASVKALSEIPVTDAARAQAQALLDADPEVREAAEKALKARDAQVAMRAAAQLIGSEERPLRLVGVQLAAQLKHNDAGATLREAFRDDDVGLAIAAAPGYARYLSLFPGARDPFVARLKTLLERAESDAQLLAIGQAAGVAQCTELLPHYRAWLDGGTGGQRRAAVAALGHIGDKRTPAKLLPLLESPDMAMRETAQLALVTLFDRGLREWVRWHYGGRMAPTDAEGWKAWWVEQRWVHDKSEEVEKAKELARALISKGTFASMDRAERICRQNIELLHEIQTKTDMSQKGLIDAFRQLLSYSLKMRPTK